MIEVFVMDEEGKPLKDVRLIATSLADNRKREIGKRVNTLKTDKDGYILMGGFKPSETNYLITAMHQVEKSCIDKGNGIRLVTMKNVHAPGKLFVKLNAPEVIQ